MNIDRALMLLFFFLTILVRSFYACVHACVFVHACESERKCTYIITVFGLHRDYDKLAVAIYMFTNCENNM